MSRKQAIRNLWLAENTHVQYYASLYVQNFSFNDSKLQCHSLPVVIKFISKTCSKMSIKVEIVTRLLIECEIVVLVGINVTQGRSNEK